MDFFQSLTLDLKMLVVGIAGCVLLALFSGNRKSEKRYMIALTVLAVVSVYRFTRAGGEEEAQRSATVRPVPQASPAPQKPTPLVSTSAR
jgi:hypothetical protein